MQKRDQTKTDFVNCFAALSKIDSVYLRLDDFIDKYIDFLLNKPYSDKILMIKINHLFEFVVNFHKLKIVKKNVSLGAYKNLLQFKLSVINTFNVKKKEQPKEKKEKKVKAKPVKIYKMKKSEKEIWEFMKSKDKIQNKEIFDQFKDMHPRSIKRHISNLIKKGHIKREAEGKSVYYLHV